MQIVWNSSTLLPQRHLSTAGTQPSKFSRPSQPRKLDTCKSLQIWKGRERLQCRSRNYQRSQAPLDTTLAWGDILTLAATEISSDRVPLNQTGFLAVILVLAWVGAATAKGDYTYKGRPSQLWFGQQQVEMLTATLNAMLTWVMFAPVALACYASLMSHSLLPKVAFTSCHGEMPAQMEVLIACLATVSGWRGIYAALQTLL